MVGDNSGGGLFVDGELADNMCITLVIQEVTRATVTAVLLIISFVALMLLSLMIVARRKR